MKIFISWSGDLSKAIAQHFAEWLKYVIQATEPWISTRNIESGSIWFNEIRNELKDTTTGVVCLTKENLKNPWILFEAGALAKGLDSSRVYTLLIDLESSDVEAPLAQFNHTIVGSKSSMLKLVQDLNSRLPKALEARTLERTFELHWPEFEKLYREALANATKPQIPLPERTTESKINEILENTRSLAQRVSYLEEHDESFKLDRMAAQLVPTSLLCGSRPLIGKSPAPSSEPQ